MGEAEKVDPSAHTVVRVALEVAQEHLILRGEHHDDLSPFVDLGRFHLSRPLDRHPDPDVHGELRKKCIKHINTRGISHRRNHSSALAAVNRISERLCERLTGTKFEVIQHINPANFDLKP